MRAGSESLKFSFLLSLCDEDTMQIVLPLNYTKWNWQRNELPFEEC